MFLFSICIAMSFAAICQVNELYIKDIELHRLRYKNDFLKDENSPLSKKDTQYLRFFDPDIRFKVKAEFTKEDNAVPFDMATYSGKTKSFIKYGRLEFKIDNVSMSLFVYKNIKLAESKEYADYLFIPFKDLTCGSESYGGGRYIDIKTWDVTKENTLMLDFNKCYNPYCAYSSGYNCPIPPKENWLDFKITAGEKQFARHIKQNGTIYFYRSNG
ncbi:MAG TPA: DUF1684 domain-containing protein [Saprospiraceae bacterium]|nr:DUF1684 domain-containing protein [Saprospiraceae bacterium]